MITGVALTDDIAEELINLVETGGQWMYEFIEECKVKHGKYATSTVMQ